MNKFHGLGTALITPFQPDGSVDYKALEQLLDLQIAGGADYLVVLGTTAEAATKNQWHSACNMVFNSLHDSVTLIV